MKKALKFVGNLFKWYMVLDVLILAFIGGSRCAKEYRKHPERGFIDANGEVINKAVNQYKKYFKS